MIITSKTTKSLFAIGFLCFTSAAVAMPFKTIERSSYTGVWPFNANEVQLQCLNGNPYVMNFDDNNTYALTGAGIVKGKSFGALPLDNNNKFWLNNKDMPGAKMSLADITSSASELCDK